MFILPVLLSQLMDQFGLGLRQITSLWTLCYFIYGVMALPAGILTDRLGYKVALMMYHIGTPVTLCIVGSARSTTQLSIGLVLMGIFASIYHPASMAMISHTVKERGRALGFQGMFGNIGLAFASVIAGGLASRLSWRYAYYILSIPSFIVSILFLPVFRWAERWERNNTVSSLESSQEALIPSRGHIPVGPVVVLYIAMTLVGFCYQGVTTMLPTYLDSNLLFSVNPEFQADLENAVISEGLRQEFDGNSIMLSPEAKSSVKKAGNRWTVADGNRTYTIRKEAGKLKVYSSTGRGKMYVTMVLLVGMLGQYIGGHTADRHRKTRLYMLFNVLSLPFIILVGLISGAWLILVAALFTMFHFSGQPVENSLVAQYTPPKLRSSGYGLKFVFSFGVGSFAAAFSGYVGEHYGLNVIFLALGGVVFLMVIVMAILVMIAKEPRVETPK